MWIRPLYTCIRQIGHINRLEGYIDVDWAGHKADRRFTFGFVFSLGSGAISWSSKKKPTVALSSIEAEYKGGIVAACNVVWLKRILKDQDVSIKYPILYCDNMSSIHMARNCVFHARIKHIEVQYHFILERVMAATQLQMSACNTSAPPYKRLTSSRRP